MEARQKVECGVAVKKLYIAKTVLMYSTIGNCSLVSLSYGQGPVLHVWMLPIALVAARWSWSQMFLSTVVWSNNWKKTRLHGSVRWSCTHGNLYDEVIKGATRTVHLAYGNLRRHLCKNVMQIYSTTDILCSDQRCQHRWRLQCSCIRCWRLPCTLSRDVRSTNEEVMRGQPSHEGHSVLHQNSSERSVEKVSQTNLVC